jgi:DNA-binding PadR family transcriptional regulator
MMFHRHPHEHEHRHRSFGFGSPWEGGGRGHGRHEGRGRGRRGNTRAAVLALLIERPMHGYEMISELEQRTGGAWRPSPGSIYPTLQMLEEEGLVTVAEPGEGGKRRYTLTEQGRAEAERGERPWHDFDQSHIAQLQSVREAGFGIMQAMRQIGMTGTDAQRAQAIEILNDTKRRLYALLAE